MWQTCEGWSLRCWTIWLFCELGALCCTVSIIRIRPSKWAETRPKNRALSLFSATALALSHANFPALDKVTAVDGHEDGVLPNVRRKEWSISGRGMGWRKGSTTEIRCGWAFICRQRQEGCSYISEDISHLNAYREKHWRATNWNFNRNSLLYLRLESCVPT